MKFEVLSAVNPACRQRWLEFLSSWSENPPPFCFPSYMKLFLEPSSTPHLLTYETDKSKAMLPLVVRRIPGIDSGVDAIGPYGYASAYWQGEVDEQEEFWNLVRSWAIENQIISVVMRLPVIPDSSKVWPFSRHRVKINVVRSIDAWEDLWADFDHKVRKNYKKASRLGLTFEMSSQPSKLDAFLEIYEKTMARRAAEGQYTRAQYWFPRVFEELEGQCLIALASVGSRVVSAEAVLHDGLDLYSFLGGTLSDYYQFRPNDFLKCELMRWARGIGFTNYVLGGGYQDGDGIFRYKSSFAPRGEKEFFIGEWIVLESTYQQLVHDQQRQKIDSAPRTYPAYRR